jgi:hypothetical protein
MIRDKQGRVIELDSVLDLEDGTYKVQDIDKGVIVVTPVTGRQTKTRYALSELGLVDDDPIDFDRAVRARRKLREFWED